MLASDKPICNLEPGADVAVIERLVLGEQVDVLYIAKHSKVFMNLALFQREVGLFAENDSRLVYKCLLGSQVNMDDIYIPKETFLPPATNLTDNPQKGGKNTGVRIS